MVDHFVLRKKYGNNKCEICGFCTVTDKHHHTETEQHVLCPNCHGIITRFDIMEDSFSDVVKKVNKIYAEKTTIFDKQLADAEWWWDYSKKQGWI